MILTCPACSTRYAADPTALGAGGRMVRCAKCGHSWLQMPPADMPRQIDVKAPAPPTRRRPGLMAHRHPAAGGAGRAGGLVLAGLALGLALAIAYVGRERVVAAWPEAKQLYDMVGIRATAIGAGLDLGNVTFVLRQAEGDTVMTIDGRIANRTALALPLPMLRATLRNDRNQWLAEWNFKLEQATIAAGETLAFRTATKNPPKDAKRLSITFVEGDQSKIVSD